MSTITKKISYIILAGILMLMLFPVKHSYAIVNSECKLTGLAKAVSCGITVFQEG